MTNSLHFLNSGRHTNERNDQSYLQPLKEAQCSSITVVTLEESFEWFAMNITEPKIVIVHLTIRDCLKSPVSKRL
jgi:hypothetical protein